jgi:hypothetical protein
MPKCRKFLAETASSSVVSGSVLVGENCHIVAEKKDGPRGKSALTTLQRNRYPNLILLCLHHHTVVDQDPTEWPVERLHQIKSEHELWVDSMFTNATESVGDELYSNLVNLATEGLDLAHWDGISDHAIRSIVPVLFIDGVDQFTDQVFKTIWPGTKPELEANIQNLASRADAFTRQFLTRAYIRHTKYYAEDLRWKGELNHYELRDIEYANSTKWRRQSADLLVNLVVALNEFGDSVRTHLNPKYFQLQGRFTLHDSLGVTNDMKDIHYMPTTYIDVAA